MNGAIKTHSLGVWTPSSVSLRQTAALHCDLCTALQGYVDKGEALIRSRRRCSFNEDESIVLLKCKLSESLSYHWNISPPQLGVRKWDEPSRLTGFQVSEDAKPSAEHRAALEDERRSTLISLYRATSSDAPPRHFAVKNWQVWTEAFLYNFICSLMPLFLPLQPL